MPISPKTVAVVTGSLDYGLSHSESISNYLARETKMRYPAPDVPDPNKELEATYKAAERYHTGAIQVRNKLKKLKATHKKITDSLRRTEILAESSSHDAAAATESLNVIKQKLKDFDTQIQMRGKTFKDDMFALEELKEGIQKQTDEVWGRINGLSGQCLDWKFANQLNSDVCSSARTNAYGMFYRWALFQPLLKIWMATDSQVHRTTYASAAFEGVYEELMAHFEVKDGIEQFGEDHYAVYKETEDLVRTVKQATEERYMRSQLLDAQHSVAAKKLQKLVNSCKVLKKEIQQREELRFKLNGLMMELSNALEEDLKSAFEVCENEAHKPSNVTVADLRAAVETGVLESDGVSSHSKSTAFASTTAADKEGMEESKEKDGKNKHSAQTVQSKTEKNTLLNGVSKLPLLVQKTNTPGANGTLLSTTSSPSRASGAGTPGASGSRPFDNVYAQLPQYDAAAIAYVRSFDAPKRSKVWKWCKKSAPEVSKCVQGMYPSVKGPVELVQSEPAPPGSSPKSPYKSPTNPTFRRRAGHSSKQTAGQDRLALSVDYFARDRNISVGAAGMPLDWLTSQPGQLANEKPASPSESAEDARRRALKFMLNDRETHYDLLSREKADALTLMQMEQARAMALAKRKRDAELADPNATLSSPAPELEHHQYRTHQLLTSDYSGKAGDETPGSVNASDEYSLYVSLPEMSAHSGLTARQAVRAMQSTNASITLQTVSKISEILQEATYTALATRANTAFDPPSHRVIGGYGVRPSASPPRSPTAGQSAKHNNFRPYSALTTHSAASTGRFATLEDNIEDQTASVLDSYPIESQAQDLNERVAQEFQATREKVEDWIETHVQCNYKSTKRALIELISNLELDLHTDEANNNNITSTQSDLDDSSVEGGALGLALARGSSAGKSPAVAAVGVFGPGSMNATLKNMLSMSRTLISSIEKNLQEFGREHSALMPDYISDHRRPNSSSALATMGTNTSNLPASGEDNYFEEEEEERSFDPRDYAFNQSLRVDTTNTMTPAPARGSPGRRSPNRNRNVMRLNQQQGLSANSWPTKRCVLHSMESIICGELFVVDYVWVPEKKNTELIAKNYVNKTEYRQYKMTVSPAMIAELTNTPRDLSLHTLFHDSVKVTQAVISSLTKETLDQRFYHDIAKTYRHCQQVATQQSRGRSDDSGQVFEFEPTWSTMMIEEMLHPKNIVTRRGSIGQLYRPGSSEKSRPSTPEMRMSKRITEAAEEAALLAQQAREYTYLMQILTMRKKQGEMVAYSFPTSHTIVTDVLTPAAT